MSKNNLSIHFEVGTKIKDGLLQFDIWFGTVKLTEIDNMAFPSSLLVAAEDELNQLKERRLNPDKFWFDFAEIVDNFLHRLSC